MCLGSQNFTVNCVKGHNFVFNWNMQAVHKAETDQIVTPGLLAIEEIHDHRPPNDIDESIPMMSPSYPTLNWVLRFFLQR